MISPIGSIFLAIVVVSMASFATYLFLSAMNMNKKAVFQFLATLTDSDRKALMDEVAGIYCKECWCEHPNSLERCQCWNDE